MATWLEMRPAFAVASVTFLLLSYSAGDGRAEEDIRFPRLAGTVVVEFQIDKSDDAVDLFSKTEVETILYFTRQFTLNTVSVFEPVLDPAPGEDRFFEDHGLYLENVFLQFESGPIRTMAGKFNPSFGIAWEAAPGVFGVDFAEDYELTEMLGGGFALTAKSAGAQLVFSANLFAADTSFLSDSVFTQRGRLRHADGGAANTRDLESFSASLDVSDLSALPGFTFHLAGRHLARGLGDFADESGFAVGGQQEFELGKHQAITLIGEFVHLSNADAGTDDRWYWTSGAEFTSGPWNFSLSHTVRRTSVAGGGDVTDWLAQVSAGYEVQFGPLEGVAVNVGLKQVREDGAKDYVLGIVLSREVKFTSPK